MAPPRPRPRFSGSGGGSGGGFPVTLEGRKTRRGETRGGLARDRAAGRAATAFSAVPHSPHIYTGSTPARGERPGLPTRRSQWVARLRRHVLGDEALRKGPCSKFLRTVDWAQGESEHPSPRLARLLAASVWGAGVPIPGLYLDGRRQDAGCAGVGAAWAPRFHSAAARTFPSPASAGPGRSTRRSGLRSGARDREVAATAWAVGEVPARPSARRRARR